MHYCMQWRPLGNEFCMSNSLNKCDVYDTINRGKIGLSDEMSHFNIIKNTKKGKFERNTLLNKRNNRRKHYVGNAVLFTTANTVTTRKM